MIKAKCGMQITLGCGRRLYVDLLVIETELTKWGAADLAHTDLPLLLRRRNMGVYEHQWFEHGPVHFILPEPFPDDGMPGDSALVSVLLWSEPVVDGFAFSELMVVFFVEWSDDVEVSRAMQEKLWGLDWASLATDRCATAPAPDRAVSAFSEGSPE